MKILYTNFHRTYGGGHTTYIVHLVKLLSLEHECHVAAPQGSLLYSKAEQIPGVHMIKQTFSSRPQQILAEICAVRQLLKSERYDIVHVNGSADQRIIVLACLGLKNRPRIVFTKHNDHKLNSLGNRLRACGTDRIIAVSHYVKELFKETPYKNIPIDLIYHGVDTDYFAPAHDPAKRRQRRQELVGDHHENLILLGSTGGTDFAKGWMEMVQAIALLPHNLRDRCRVIVAGSPPPTETLKQIASLNMQNSAIFPGLLNDVRPTLGACDLGFVLSYRETLSFACRESMALGLPTIVTNVGGLPENIQHLKNGWIVPVKDPVSLSHLLSQILLDTSLQQAIGRAARETAKNDFNLALFAQNTLLCYDKLLTQKKV